MNLRKLLILSILLSLPFLSGFSCASLGGSVAVTPPAIPANCEAKCYEPCTIPADLKYVPVPESKRAFDDLAEQVVAPLKLEFDQCDTHRQACVQCLNRLEKAGRITQ